MSRTACRVVLRGGPALPRGVGSDPDPGRDGVRPRQRPAPKPYGPSAGGSIENGTAAIIVSHRMASFPPVALMSRNSHVS